MSRQVIGPVRHLDEIDSTNRYLADEVRAGAATGLVAIAKYQTAGRGRLDRRWEAPAGANLLMSVLLRLPADLEQDLEPHLEPEPEPALEPHLEPFHLTVATALAASDACREIAGVEAGLKWPNDLVVRRDLDVRLPKSDKPRRIRELKLAGILSELVSVPGSPPAVVVGLGLNVGWPAPEPAEPEMKGATSLARLSNRPTDLDSDSVGEVVLDHLDRRITDLFLPGGAKRQIEEYRSRCVTIGRMVGVEEPAGTYTGKATGITDQGHLVVGSLSESDPWTREVTAGDVIHLAHRYAVWGRGTASP